MSTQFNNRERVTLDQLVTIGDLDRLKTDLIETMQRLLKPGSVPQAKPWLKTQEARKLLGISAGKLLTLRVNGTLPFPKIGSVIYYKAEDIDRNSAVKGKSVTERVRLGGGRLRKKKH